MTRLFYRINDKLFFDTTAFERELHQLPFGMEQAFEFFKEWEGKSGLNLIEI